jgi:hypothetical protein
MMISVDDVREILPGEKRIRLQATWMTINTWADGNAGGSISRRQSEAPVYVAMGQAAHAPHHSVLTAAWRDVHTTAGMPRASLHERSADDERRSQESTRAALDVDRPTVNRRR